MSTTEPHVRSQVDTRVQTRWEYSPTSDESGVPLLVHCPDQPRGWLVWAHGGSWQYGSARQWAPVTGRIAALSGWAVISVDYRLVPGHHHPAAVLDTLAALGWAEQQADSLPIVIGGDSAGGTIAALAALTRRNTGDRVPLQLLAYPPLDPECSRASYPGSPGVPPDRPGLVAAWRLWLGDHTSPRSVPTTPLQADSLTGLAPVSLVVGAETRCATTCAPTPPGCRTPAYRWHYARCRTPGTPTSSTPPDSSYPPSSPCSTHSRTQTTSTNR
ncbi:alpha/beta hydrolase [Corynebacterium sp. CNJ-954]|uniref:alpha/beta hydrolase n=1 Tax=Corynebacterium sp. CNJ-954 TaxID=1904962 RepID=UPI00096AC87E|nr:alpha/beta hydrolase fold domain-containing protein [Corynebacterium sp. CNJ-954]